MLQFFASWGRQSRTPRKRSGTWCVASVAAQDDPEKAVLNAEASSAVHWMAANVSIRSSRRALAADLTPGSRATREGCGGGRKR